MMWDAMSEHLLEPDDIIRDRDEEDALHDDEGDHVYAYCVWDAVNKKWVDCAV